MFDAARLSRTVKAKTLFFDAETPGIKFGISGKRDVLDV